MIHESFEGQLTTFSALGRASRGPHQEFLALTKDSIPPFARWGGGRSDHPLGRGGPIVQLGLMTCLRGAPLREPEINLPHGEEDRQDFALTGSWDVYPPRARAAGDLSSLPCPIGQVLGRHGGGKGGNFCRDNARRENESFTFDHLFAAPALKHHRLRRHHHRHRRDHFSILFSLRYAHGSGVLKF